MDIQQTIPSSIASKLEQIKLYMKMHSVTAFVGAGFSLNADKSGNVRMKTWNQLRDTFLDKLYPNNEQDKNGDNNDVVRLASLVDAQFGHNELDNILQDALPDNLIRPGKLHRMLVKLPWKDILTTNYDTLIERAAAQVICEFKLVTNKDTLLYRPSPRIIKLHGSMPDIHPYIMTQEDYRRYPTERPDMVNTAKQCFLESLVCLIGFSGEDPNFRAWIGWLRDVIGQQRLCPTYLITYSKGFHDAEKALLSRMGIDIVNLAEIEGVKDHYSALEFFFNYLQDISTRWNGKVEFDMSMPNDNISDDEFKVYIEKKIKEMQMARMSYPGWLILPQSYEKDFQNVGRDIVRLERTYNRIVDKKIKLYFLYELNWRLYVSATPCNVDWFVNALNVLAENVEDVEACDIWMLQSLLLTYLTVLRYKNERERFCKLCQQILAKGNLVPSRHIHYQQALYWLARYDKNSIMQTLAKWQIETGDYQNCLQKANILYCMDEKLEAFHILTDCKEAIAKSLLQNKDDVYAKSCLTYVLNTMGWCDRSKAPVYDNLRKSAIGESFDVLTDRLSGKAYDNTKQFGFCREHKFKLGDYTNSWNLGSTGFVKDYQYPYRWWMLKERIGIPMFLTDENYTRYCIQKMFGYSCSMAWNMMMLSASAKVVDNVFGREQLALISEEQANEYFDTYITLFETCNTKDTDWANNKILNVLPIVLGRLCTKVSQERVLRFVKSALKWSPVLVNKVLPSVYDCLDNRNLAVIWSLLLTEKKFNTKYNRDGYDIPDRYMIDFVITDNIEKRIFDGLGSTDKDAQIHALIIFQMIWQREELTDDDKRKISDAIIKMRDSECVIPEAVYTYTNIDADEAEKTGIESKLDNDVKTFCETNYIFSNSSEPFSKWYDMLERLNTMENFLSEEMKKMVLHHCCDMIELNKVHFEKDDSQDFLGGMRHFTCSVVRNFQSLFLNANIDDWTDEEHQKFSEQIEWLQSSGYHCLPMKVKVTIRKQQHPTDEIIGQIDSHLLSKDEAIQSDGINALFVLKDNGRSIDDILSYVFSVFALADSKAYKELLILFANLVARGYEDNNFIAKLIDLLNNIHQNFRSYDLDIVSLADLQHYANFAAGTMSVKNQNLRIPIFNKEEAKFNDVEFGFDKGKEFALRKMS